MTNKITEKTKYILKVKDTDEEVIPFYVTQSIGYQFENSLITYETVGSDGGFTINTGRVTQEIPVTIQLIGNELSGGRVVSGEGLQKNLKFIRTLRDEKRPVTIFGNINKHQLFGYYLIKTVGTTITDGTDSLIVEVTLREYRDVNITTENVVLPSSKAASDVVQYLRNYNQVRNN